MAKDSPINRSASPSAPRPSATVSLAESLASLAPEQVDEILSELTFEELSQLEWDWVAWARPAQLAPPGSWSKWLVLAGRGWGKTRTGTEFIRDAIEQGAASRAALVAATSADVRDVLVEGPSGLLKICPPWNRPNYEPSKRRLTWPSGATATLYSADEPERLRGPEHDIAYCDEIAVWRFLRDAWDNLMFGLRVGAQPRVVITTTPRPVAVLRELITDPTCVITRGSTYDNRANLAPSFFTQIVKKYEGTRLGRQELQGELLEDVEGALWTRALIEDHRVWDTPEFERIAVAIDPAVTSGEDSDETGIIVGGSARDSEGNYHLYVTHDLSGRFPAIEWARKAVQIYHELGADRIVAEVNNGGDLVESQLRVVDEDIAYRAVHASRGKRVRAEPVAALSEQGRLHMVGSLPVLEDQCCNFTPDAYDASPDRVDAMVWLAYELVLNAVAPPDRNPAAFRKVYR